MRFINILLPKRLGTQIVSLVSLLLLIATLLLTLFTNHQSTQQVTTSIKEQAKVLAQNVATSGSSYLFSTYYEPLETLLRQSVQFPGVVSISVFDSEGNQIRKALHQNGNTTIATETLKITLPEKNELHIEESEKYITTWMPIIRNFLQGWVMVQYSVESLDQIQINNLLTNFFFGGLTITLIVTIILFYLRRPLRYIREAALYAELLDSNKRSQFPIYKNALELTKLGESLNLASYRLTVNEQEIKSSLHALETQKFAMDQHSIVSITDTAGNITYANTNFCEVSGYSQDELLGNSHKLLNSGVHTKEFFSRLWSTLNDGRVWHGEICNLTKTGEHFWVDTTIVPFLDSEGRPYQFVAIRTEITEHKKALNDLNESKQRIQQSQTFANIGSWELEIKSQTVRFSENTASLFGREPPLILKNYTDMLALIHHDDHAHVSKAIESCILLGKKYVVEYRSIWPDGSVHWLQDSGNVLRDEFGKAKKLFGIIQDVTEQKLSAEKIESLARFPDENPNPVLRVSVDERITYCNPSGQWLLDYWHVRIFDKVPDELLFLLKEAVSQQNNIAADISVGERYFGVTISFTPGYKYFNVYMRDITERYHAEEKLQEYQKHLEYLIDERTKDLIEARDAALMAERSMSTFLANMSHELRTPLHAILSFATFGIRKIDKVSKDKIIQYFTEINESGRNLLGLVNNLLDLSKLRAGKMSYHYTDQDMTTIIAQVIKELRLLLDNKQIQIEFDEASYLPVQCDVERISQVIRNLVSNAIKFSPPNTAISIHTSFSELQEIEVQIMDQGPGIPSSELELIFVPFEQSSKTMTNAGGTGLGLSICKEIIQAGHQGVIYANNRDGGGSIFTFKISAHRLDNNTDSCKAS